MAPEWSRLVQQTANHDDVDHLALWIKAVASWASFYYHGPLNFWDEAVVFGLLKYLKEENDNSCLLANVIIRSQRLQIRMFDNTVLLLIGTVYKF